MGGKIFADIERLLTEGDFRKSVLSQVTDPVLLRFWQHQFPALPKGAVDPILNKLSPFTVNRIVRNILGQTQTKLRFFEMMQTGKILLLP